MGNKVYILLKDSDFQNGKMFRTKGEIVFEEFSPEKLGN